MYGLIGVGALQLSTGIASAQVDAQGEIVWLRQVQYGFLWLALVAVGLAGYAAWGFVRAGIDLIDPKEDVSVFQRLGYLFSAVSHTLLSIFAIQLLLHLDELFEHDDLQQQIQTIMSYPFGGVLVMLGGLLVIIGGLYQLQKAIRADRPIDFLSRQKHPVYSVPFMLFAKTGVAVRAVTFVFIGYYVVRAGWLLDPDKIHTLKSLLLTMQDAKIGAIVLPVVGIGFLCFACYSFLLSWWVDLPDA